MDMTEEDYNNICDFLNGFYDDNILDSVSKLHKIIDDTVLWLKNLKF